MIFKLQISFISWFSAPGLALITTVIVNQIEKGKTNAALRVFNKLQTEMAISRRGVGKNRSGKACCSLVSK